MTRRYRVWIAIACCIALTLGYFAWQSFTSSSKSPATPVPNKDTEVAKTTTKETPPSPPSPSAPPVWKPPPPPKVKPGVHIHDPRRAYQGYTLIAPMQSIRTYLIDMEGRVVKTWHNNCTPALSTYLLENGNLLRPGNIMGGLAAPGAGGCVQETTWDGKLLWDFRYETDEQYLHHDVARLPNGNFLMLVAERKALLSPGTKKANDEILADAIFEVKPTGSKTGDIVWQWHAVDHILQEVDKSRPNFAKASERPERIDINYRPGMFGKTTNTKDDLDKLKAIGYLGSPSASNSFFNPSNDWTHFNSIAYNAELDQIMVSVRNFNEFWIIDHSTTTKEAAGSSGGKSGKGGDLLYRWGNPQAYRSGTNVDRQLCNQHDAHWIPRGLPGAGNVLLFNNGKHPDTMFSTVEEIVLPVKPDGSYERQPNTPFGPSKPRWTYTAPTKTDLFSDFYSGTQRLPNGNTLVCSTLNWLGKDRHAYCCLFEVTPDNEVVWKYVMPGLPTRQGLFRAYRYSPDFPAFKGRDLTPGKTLEEVFEQLSKEFRQ